MQQRDIRNNIIRSSTDDIKNLIKMCSVDKLSQDICSSLSFWRPIFEERNFHFPKIIPTTHTA